MAFRGPFIAKNSRSHEFRSNDAPVPVWLLTGRAPVALWGATLKRADALHDTEAAAGGVDLVYALAPPRSNYRSTVRVLRALGFATAIAGMVA